MLKFKSSRDARLFCCLHPILIMIYADLNNYAKSKYGVDLVITESITTEEIDKLTNRKSSSHRESRAVDIRTKDLDLFIREDIIRYINKKPEYKEYHYLKRSGSKTLAYFHGTGSNEHIHLAIHSRYKFPF